MEGRKGGEGGRKGVKRNAALVLLASSLAVLYVVAGGCVKRGREGLAVGVVHQKRYWKNEKRTIVEMSRLGTIRSELLPRQEYSQGYVARQNFLLVVAVLLLLLLILFSVSSDATQLGHTKKLTPPPPPKEEQRLKKQPAVGLTLGG